MSVAFLRPLAAFAVVLGLPVAAFVAGRPEPLPAADFRFVLPKENSSLDPAAATTVSDGWLLHALFEGLTRLDPVTLEPRPGAAARWEVSADARTFTFHLRADGRWSDGAPVRAQDFVYAWRRVLEPGVAAQNAELMRPLAGALEILRGSAPPASLGVAAHSDFVLEVRTRGPCAWLPVLLSHFLFAPLREDLVARHGERFTEREAWVSNGPYVLGLRRIRDRVRLERNPRWHGARDVAFSTIDALAVDAPSTSLNLYLTGDVDWVNAVPASAIEYLRGRPDLRMSVALATTFLRFNVTRPPLDDVRVRRALDLAMRRDELCRHVYRRGETPATSLVPPALGGYRPAAAPPEDAAVARALLAAAGFPGGAGFPELELLHAADENVRPVAEALAAQLSRTLGVRLRPVPQEYKVFIDSQRTLRYSVCLASWVGDYPDPGNFLGVFHSASGSNRTGWADAGYDALLERADALLDADARAAVLREAEALLLEEGPIAPVAYRGQPNLVAPWVEGFTTNLLDLHPLERLRRR